MIHFKRIWNLLYLILFQSFISTAQFHQIKYNWKSFKHSDAPTQKDLSTYLKTVELVTTYFSQNINEIDINLAFGIFLSNVNFKRVLKDKEMNLPSNVKTKLKHIILKNEETLFCFQKVMKDDSEVNVVSREHKQIFELFTNISTWVDRLKEFVTKRQKYYNLKYLENTYSQWKYYLEDVDNVKKWIPSPELSDMCLVSLSNNSIDEKDPQPSCAIEDSCYTMLKKGTDFGYALCHRALLLLMARLGRGCSVFSPKKDKALMDKYCSMGYKEVVYIVMNDYRIADLMMEIMCLCSLEGQAQFLRRSWLRQILNFQKRRGCFGTDIKSIKIRAPLDGTGNYFKVRNENVSHQQCDGHTTAVALGIFSAAIRYIIQEYY